MVGGLFKERKNDMEQELYSVAQFLEKYAIGRTSFYAAVAKNEIPIIKRGKRTFVARTDAQVWLEGLRQKTNGGAV